VKTVCLRITYMYITSFLLYARPLSRIIVELDSVYYKTFAVLF